MNKILAACFCALLASCMGSDYADPNMTENPFGNSQIAETNVDELHTRMLLYSMF